MSRSGLRSACALLALLLGWGSAGAQMTLFADNEARQELLNLRQRLGVLERTLQDESRARRELSEQLQSAAALLAQEAARRREMELALDRLSKSSEDQAQLRRGSLELLNQIEQLRQDQARLRGENEALKDFVAGFQRGLADVRQGLSDAQRAVKDTQSLVEERIRKVEPVKISLDGREFEALPAESAAYEAAVKAFGSDEHKQAQAAFEQFLLRYPASGYRPWVLYWLGTSQQATEDFKAAQSNLRSLLRDFPGHPRSADAMLGLAGVQFDLKEPRAAVRKTLEDLIKAYPGTRAAAVARERLARLK